MTRLQGIARGAALLTALLGLACATPAVRELDVRSDAADRFAAALAADPDGVSPDALVVRLSFAADVDLDLYVTDPLEETVYYGNSPSRIGGRLLRDVRCDGEAPRVETVVIDPAPSGRYRVGVDFPERCAGDGATDFALRVDFAGERRERTGRLAPRIFEPVVLELETP
ncbi:MAG: hypothetical protein HKP30_08225 [Myxococcales bacterium]|nr:hypothetical protein [Myxococcales bacterium]